MPITTCRKLLIFGLLVVLASPFNPSSLSNAYPGDAPPDKKTPRLQEQNLRARVAQAYTANCNQRAADRYKNLPLSFEANHERLASNLDFIARASQYNVYLKSNEAIMELPHQGRSVRDGLVSAKQNQQPSFVRLRLAGARTGARAVGLNELPGKSNYFAGNNPKRWRTNIPTYARVKYDGVYPGIDIVYYGNQRQLEYDFHVAPGADFKAIRLRFDGARRLRIDSNGDLLIDTSFGEIRQHRPLIYQEDASGMREVSGRYLLKRQREVTFEIDSYDKSRPLVIDPILAYSTYLGGPFNDEANALAVDAEGNAYIAGNSLGGFPRSGGGFSNRAPGAFIAKLNPAGTHLLYSAVLESGNANGIAVNSFGSAYLTGVAFSDDFPTTPDAFERSNRGGWDVFVTKLNSEGNDLEFSTLIGGETQEHGNAIAIDAEGSAYITGETHSRNYPIKNSLLSFFGDDDDSSSVDGFKPQLSPAPPHWAFVTKLNPGGTRLVYSSYLSSLNSLVYQTGYAIAVDSAGQAHVTGSILGGLPTTSGAFQRANAGRNDAFIIKLAADGKSLIFSTYLGGSGFDEARALGLDGAGNVYVAGRTQLTNFPTTAGAFQPNNSDASFIRSSDGGITWSPISKGLNAISVNQLVSTPFPTAKVYAIQSGDGRLFRSSDQGASWNSTSPPVMGLANVLVVDPSDPLTVYAGAADSFFSPARGVVKTTDGGDTWTTLNSVNVGYFVTSIDVDPSDPSVVYVGTTSGLFKSTDGGSNWKGTGLPIGAISSVAVDPKNSSTIYASSSSVIKSTDGGNSWKATGAINASATRIIIDPATPSTIYALTHSGLRKSIDGGDSWRFTGRFPFDNEFILVNSLAIDPVNSTTLYAATNRGIFKSIDGGETWIRSGFIDPGTRNSAFYTNTVNVDRANSSNIYAGVSARAEAFVTKLNSSGSQLVYSTYLGSIGEDVITGLALDAAGNVSVVGYTDSPSFPTTADGFTVRPGIDNSRDGFSAKLNVTGSALIHSTYLGTPSFDSASAVAIDGLGNVYITGTTASFEFATTPGSFQRTKPGQNSGFILKLSPLKLTGASISGKKLMVSGEGFGRGAVIVIDGADQKTKNDGATPSSVLIAKKAGKKILLGQSVLIQVRNPDGALSDALSFTRSSS